MVSLRLRKNFLSRRMRYGRNNRAIGAQRSAEEIGRPGELGTMAPCVVIGEKAAEAIKAEHGL